ncbi:MAG: hypothetical protein ABJX32_06220 [Tateyamaria sp.]|uniref:hypothetical protein n=1 Tax=Tateyamaria sp. TaxID=1929288 RepID=UPI0032A0CEC2
MMGHFPMLAPYRGRNTNPLPGTVQTEVRDGADCLVAFAETRRNTNPVWLFAADLDAGERDAIEAGASPFIEKARH